MITDTLSAPATTDTPDLNRVSTNTAGQSVSRPSEPALNEMQTVS